MSVGARIMALFIEPAPEPAAAVTRAETIVVLCRAAHAARAGRAVAQAARARAGTGSVLVCAWGAGAGARGGWVELGGDADACLAELGRACASARPGPLVLMLCGERPEQLEPLIAGADAVIVAAEPGDDEEVASIVLERSAAPGQRGGVLVVDAGPGARVADRVTDALARSARNLLDDDAGARSARAGGQAHALA